MNRFLYRGVSIEMHEANKGLSPKGTSFSSEVECGSSIAECGNGITLGNSLENALIGHQFDSSEYLTSGISTTTELDIAKKYATYNGKYNGVVYVIDTFKLDEFRVNSYKVDEYIDFPKIKEDKEVILIHYNQSALPEDIIYDIMMISKDYKSL